MALSLKDTIKATVDKTVSTVASQGLSDTEKSNARANIGAAASSHTHSYLPLTGGTMNGAITMSPNVPAMPLTSGKVTGLPSGGTKIFKDGIAISNPTTTNDVGWMRVTGTGESDTVLEIATGDDGGSGETIVFRGYNTQNAIAYQVNVPKSSGTLSLNGHTHDDRYYTESEIDSKLSGKLGTTGNTNNNTVSFTSSDVADGSASSWTSVTALASGEKHSSIMAKLSQMFKNVRYLYKILGTTDISSIGGGTVTGAIYSLNNHLAKSLLYNSNGILFYKISENLGVLYVDTTADFSVGNWNEIELANTGIISQVDASTNVTPQGANKPVMLSISKSGKVTINTLTVDIYDTSYVRASLPVVL